MFLLAGAVACGSNGKEASGGFPENFASLPDSAKVAYVMKSSSPDSVARFICNAALGRIAEGSIDTLTLASAYAYEHYTDSALLLFSREFDEYSANLPLPEKMRIYYMAGTYDANRMGYELGLEYVNHIRESRMSVDDVKREIAAFKDACSEDSATYKRFMKGFQTVLKIDHGKDLPEEIYQNFAE